MDHILSSPAHTASFKSWAWRGKAVGTTGVSALEKTAPSLPEMAAG